MDRGDVSFFDPTSDWDVISRALPHWDQTGALTFITWRLADSLPRRVLRQQDSEVMSFLRSEGLPPDSVSHKSWHDVPPFRRAILHAKLFRIRDQFLDRGFGECHLRLPAASGIVLESLRKFDGQRYLITDVIVMPNHVHFLCAFSGIVEMWRQCENWKRFTGRQINQHLGRRGRFWQREQFDHLVRSPAQFEYLRDYIARNPLKAGLQPGQYRYYQRS